MRVNKRSEKYGVPWQAPSTVSRCPCCEARFGVTKRKHHCRMCGRVVCHGCSLIKTQVEGSDHLKRVCDDCADDLEETGNPQHARQQQQQAAAAALGDGGDSSAPTERRNLQQLLTLWITTLLKGQVGATTRFLAKGTRMSAAGELLKLMGNEMATKLETLAAEGALRSGLMPCSRSLAEFFSAYLNLLQSSGGDMEPDLLCALASQASKCRALVGTVPVLAGPAEKFHQVTSRIAHLLVDVLFLDVDELIAEDVFPSTVDQAAEGANVERVLASFSEQLTALERRFTEREAFNELVSVAAQRLEQSYLRRLFVAQLRLDRAGAVASKVARDVGMIKECLRRFVPVEDTLERLMCPLELVAGILMEADPNALRAALFDLYAAFGRGCTALVESLAEALGTATDFDVDALIAVCRADEEALVERIYEFQYGHLPKSQVRREPSPFTVEPVAPPAAPPASASDSASVSASASASLSPSSEGEAAAPKAHRVSTVMRARLASSPSASKETKDESSDCVLQ